MTTINTALAGITPSAQASSASASLASDFDSFLQLLVAQMENQDPLKPMDSTEFVSQTATLSQVEQAVQTNQNLENVVSALTLGGLVNDAGFIGKTVSYAGEEIELGQDSTATFSFELSTTSNDTTVQILAEDGTLIRDIAMGSVEGQRVTEVVWDGKDDFGNNMLPGDKFTVQVSGTGIDGASVAYNTYLRGVVEEVVFTSTGSVLQLDNGGQVIPGEVSSVT